MPETLKCKAILLSLFLSMMTVYRAYSYGGEPVCVIGVIDGAGKRVLTAGKGFAARAGGRTVLITTAHGLMELAQEPGMRGVLDNPSRLVDVLDTSGKQLGKLGNCLVKGGRGGFYTGDLMVFDLPTSSALETYNLSPTLPAAGTKVWVVSKEGHNFGSAGADKYAGTVTSSGSEGIMVRMDAPLTAFHSSGSPVVDGHGDVIGMLIGTANGRTVVGLNPSAVILQRVDPRYSSGQRTNNTRTAPPSQKGVQTYR